MDEEWENVSKQLDQNPSPSVLKGYVDLPTLSTVTPVTFGHVCIIDSTSTIPVQLFRMGWGKHWRRQRIGVAIARGRARLLLRAATGRALWGSGGRKGRQGTDAKRPSPLSTEWDQHSC